MSATLTPAGPSGASRSDRLASPALVHRVLLALSVFVGIGGIGLGIALITGAVLLFNILVFTLFTVLWIAFAVALAFSPGTLDALWRGTRTCPLVIQGVIWVLFLPLMIGLWIWKQAWAMPIRAGLALAVGAWNIFMFFPRGW